MDPVERRQFLLSIVTNAAQHHKQWVESGDSHLLPEDKLWQRFDEIAETARFINRERCSDLERLFLDFATPWKAFVASAQGNLDVTMLPAENVWRTWEALELYRRQAAMPELKSIEPLELLKEQKVSERQMCMIYGFMRADGSPDYAKLRDEFKNPGKHTGPETGWVAPVNQHIASQMEQSQIELEALRRRRESKVASANKPAPESIEQLVAEGVAARQIALMKKISVGDVIQYCRQNNIPEPPLTYDSAMQQPGQYDQTPSPERQQQMNLPARPSATNPMPPAPQSRGPVAPNPANALPAEPPVPIPKAELEAAGEESEDPSPKPPMTSDPVTDAQEGNQMQEAANYFNGGAPISDIATFMNISQGKVRTLLKRGGYDVNAARAR